MEARRLDMNGRTPVEAQPQTLDNVSEVLKARPEQLTVGQDPESPGCYILAIETEGWTTALFGLHRNHLYQIIEVLRKFVYSVDTNGVRGL